MNTELREAIQALLDIAHEASELMDAVDDPHIGAASDELSLCAAKVGALL